jgi:hypothetical protein
MPRRTPNWHRARIAQKKSADGRKVTEAARLNTNKLTEKKKERKEARKKRKTKKPPDTIRPSHGRSCVQSAICDI